ncbi:MAG TPA: hypothetical protein VFI47_12350 [Acidimicrobiales bacterium]|nr:hypothetical protein [Acidimicrobiales bacterium]
MEPTSLRFARIARALAEAARAQGLRAPTFRSPPRLPGVSRSIVRRGPVVTVAVALRDRPWPAVMADMVEGVVAANRLAGVRADRVRAALWHAVAEGSGVAA